MSTFSPCDHQGIRVGVTRDDTRITANKVAALKAKGIAIQVFCAVCGEPLTVVHYPNEEEECYFRCDNEHLFSYCQKLAHMQTCSIQNEADISWIADESLEMPIRRRKGPGPDVVDVPEGSEDSDDPESPEGPDGSEQPESPEGSEGFEGPETPEDPGNIDIPHIPGNASVDHLKQLVYSEDYYASDPLKPLPPSGKPIGNRIMLLSTNESMIRALYHFRSNLSAFTGGRFVVEGKVAHFQHQLDQKKVPDENRRKKSGCSRLDFQSTTVIDGKPCTVYFNCYFKKAADMERLLKKCANVEYTEGKAVYTPTATVLIWGDFEVNESSGKVRLKVTIKNNKQVFVLPFDQCPDRSKF